MKLLQTSVGATEHVTEVAEQLGSKLKLPGLHPSMSRSDLENHIGTLHFRTNDLWQLYPLWW
ncbi:hypothetical protein NC651_014689 [Populus alba x Populus x berolinensis]|nr:hypothetical protein NC651_014689 [Populus alba x Populus x berolinensis]